MSQRFSGSEQYPQLFDAVTRHIGRTVGRFSTVVVALYGLRQSAYKFYMLFFSLLSDLGMTRCDIDHGVFYGEWKSPPSPSIAMPSNGSNLVLIIPIHVDDGLGITNSPPL